MEERWRKIEENENYEVSDFGRVRNLKTGKMLKPMIDKEGDSTVALYSEGRKSVKKIHRLVFGNHVDRDISDSCVKHVDGNRQNNRLDNLKLKHRRKRILVVETGEIFDSITECSKALGMSISTISKCCNYSFYNNQYGYHFEEID